MDEILYQNLLETRRTWYNELGRIYCKAIEADVVFNAKGFYHLLHDGHGKPRTLADRVKRLSLLPMAVSIITNAIVIDKHRNENNV